MSQPPRHTLYFFPFRLPSDVDLLYRGDTVIPLEPQAVRVLRYLVKTLGATEEQKNAWYRHWVEQGLASLEARLIAENRAGRYSLGDAITLADVCIVPQVFNAKRMDCTLEHVPNVMRIFQNCMVSTAFIDAQPSVQPDAE